MATLPGLPARNAKRKFDAAFIDSATIDEDILNARVDKAAKTAAHLPPSGAGARSTSAPAVGWTPPAGSGQIIYDDVTVLAATDAWMDPTQKGIRLVYPLLNPAGGHNQGIFIPDAAITSSTDTELHSHFAAVKDNMLIHQNPHQITECTGEAATALAMLRTFPGAKMCWGMHLHSGAGIDQIWKLDAGMGSPAIYFIVEAKGVGATLTYKTFGPPPEIQQQMSLGWVLDNLVRMRRNGHKIAKKVLKDLGLTEKLSATNGPYYAGYGGVSKSYYACSFDAAKKTAGLMGVVVTASWNTNGLSYVVSSLDDFGAQLATSSAIKN